MLVPLTAIVTSSLPMAAAIALCAKDRSTVHASKKESGKSAREAATKSAKGSTYRGQSRRSGSKSKSNRSKRSSKSGKSAKSGKRSSHHGKSTKGSSSRSKRSAKKAGDSSAESSTAAASKASSSKSSVSKSRSKTRRLDSDAQKKMEQSGKKSPAAAAASAKSASGEASQKNKSSSVEKSLKEEVEAIKHSTQLAVVPSRLQYPVIGGVSTIEIKNNSGERKAIKVKCSDNALYRVNPVHGFAEPHSSVKIDVMRLNGEEKTDKLVFLVANAKNATEPREAFNNNREQREMMVVPLSAA